MPRAITESCETLTSSILAENLASAVDGLYIAFVNTTPEESACRKKIFEAVKEIKKAAKAAGVLGQFNDLSPCFFSQFEYKFTKYLSHNKQKTEKKAKKSLRNRIEEMQVV